MWKTVIGRAVVGAGLGIAISHIITILISASLGTGEYYPCPDELIRDTGSSLGAVIVQTVISVIYGAVCGGASVIWNIEKWGLVRQTGVYFAILFGTAIPCGYIAYWMPRDRPMGILLYILIFVAFFALIWIIEYSIGKASVRRLNSGLDRSDTSRRK